MNSAGNIRDQEKRIFACEKFITAARFPHTVFGRDTVRGGDWRIVPPDGARIFPITLLQHRVRANEADIHLADQDGLVFDTVMEDSFIELCRHIPIWQAAHGRILVTGLGLGCVVRGLLAKSEVTHIDVIEIDPWIIAQVAGRTGLLEEKRVSIHFGDARTIDLPGQWDFAWHDVWVPRNDGLQIIHGELMARFRDHIKYKQGAWEFPRFAKRLSKGAVLG